MTVENISLHHRKILGVILNHFLEVNIGYRLIYPN
jgi:hypothetical protein